MTATSPSLQRALVFIGERLVKATRDAQMRPTKNAARRLRSLEMLAAACVSDAARNALLERRARSAATPAPAPAPAPAPPPPAPAPARPAAPVEPPTEDLGPLLPPEPDERPAESGAEVRGVWAVPPE